MIETFSPEKNMSDPKAGLDSVTDKEKLIKEFVANPESFPIFDPLPIQSTLSLEQSLHRV